ncbi:MAG: cytochrome P450 [Moraxellaceae bacterium]|nr:cytochrome P450 [Moraxellaceae bacterium]
MKETTNLALPLAGAPSLPPQAPLSTLLALGGLLTGGRPEQQAYERLAHRHGPLVTVPTPMLGNVVMLLEPRLVRAMMSSPPGALISGRGNAVLGFLYGRSSMFLVDGEPHHRLRRLLVPPFRNRDTLARYAEVIEAVAEDVLDALPVGKPFALLPELRHGMLEIILRVVFGIQDEARLQPFREAMTELLDLSTSAATTARFALRRWGGLRRWERLQQALARSNALIYDQIRRHREDPATEQRDDILALLLRTRTEDGNLLTDTEIRDQLVTLLIAGHETTATTLAWAMERLLRTPDALAKLKADFAAGSTAYADAVVSETLRLRPPIPMFSREVAGDFEIGGYRLPPRTLLVAHVGYIHQRADLFPDPQAFRPERFLEGRQELGSYSPFGGGLHSCIGNHFAALEVRLFLRVLLARGDFGVPSNSPEWQMRKTILNLPWQGARVTLKRRAVRP